MDRITTVLPKWSASPKLGAGYEPVALTTFSSEGQQSNGEPTDLEAGLETEETEHFLDDEDDEDDQDILDDAVTIPPPVNRMSFVFWVAVNIVATIAIVLVNKKVLVNPNLKGAPILFVAYHFFLTGCTLQLAAVAKAFEARSAPLFEILPLASVFAMHTVVTNWSLALLEVVLYQEMRILITPATVLINYIAYRKTISWQSLLALVVVCLGISLTIFSDTRQKQAIAAAAQASTIDSRLYRRGFEFEKNGIVGYSFGLGGVLLSAWYTIGMAVYMTRFQMSALQLLHNLAPLGCILLLFAVPFLDTLPIWQDVTSHEWTLLGVSGLCAVLINVSQFFIVAGSSALSSTVVGHGKTIAIVAVGWLTATSSISLGSGFGILLAVGGIVSYGVVGLRQAAAAAK
ncbi:hypothetical protein P7C70_g2938, partial [Phenoliferia sp. Uapishka_3]